MAYDAAVSDDQAGGWRAAGTKVAHRTMREVNRSIVLDILREGTPVSRVELARRTRLSKPTVSSIVEDLLAAGVVREMGIDPSTHRTGRPPSLLVYDERSVGFAGIQFGATTTHVAVADGLGSIIVEVQVPAVHGDFERSVRDAGRALRTAITRSGMRREQIRAAGVAVAGMVEASTGRCIMAPNLSWRDVPVGQRMEAELRMPVIVASSTHAAALAELRLGGVADKRGLLWMYAGTGIGCGVVIDGEVFAGTSGLAGEIGHAPVVEEGGVRCRCGKRGCLETVAGAGAIVRSAVAALRAGRPTSLRRRGLAADVVLRHAADGDGVALAAVRTAGEHFGRGIAGLVNTLNPDVVVIGGPLAASVAYVDAARDAAQQQTLPAQRVPMVTTRLGGQGPLLGVVQLAMGAVTHSVRLIERAAAR